MHFQNLFGFYIPVFRMPKLPRFNEEPDIMPSKVVRAPDEHVVDDSELQQIASVMGFSKFDTSKNKDHSKTRDFISKQN